MKSAEILSGASHIWLIGGGWAVGGLASEVGIRSLAPITGPVAPSVASILLGGIGGAYAVAKAKSGPMKDLAAGAAGAMVLNGLSWIMGRISGRSGGAVAGLGALRGCEGRCLPPSTPASRAEIVAYADPFLSVE